MGSAGPDMAWSRQLVKKPASRMDMRRMECLARAMRSTASRSWELMGW